MKFTKQIIAGLAISFVAALFVSFLSDRSFINGMISELHPFIANSIIKEDNQSLNLVLATFTNSDINISVKNEITGSNITNFYQKSKCLISYHADVLSMNQPVGEINICRNFKSLFSRAIKSELFILLLLFTFCTAITVLILPIVNYRKAILKFAASLEINKNHDDSISDPIQRKFKEFFDKQLSLEIKNQSTLCLLQKEQEISMLAKQVSHDLKSPLSAANLALSKIETSDAYAKDLLENCLKRINEISSDVLLRSKKNSKLAMSIDLNSFISKIIAEKEMEYGNIFRLRFSNSNHILRGDEKELSRILSNLINNAWQANLKKNQTVIELNVKETDCAVFIEVKDFGGGISSEILEKLNSQEIRPTTYGKTSETESGLGLGLFHARNYIKEIGGSFKIESQQEKGTIAEIGLTKLPIQRSIFP